MLILTMYDDDSGHDEGVQATTGLSLGDREDTLVAAVAQRGWVHVAQDGPGPVGLDGELARSPSSRVLALMHDPRRMPTWNEEHRAGLRAHRRGPAGRRALGIYFLTLTVLVPVDPVKLPSPE